MKKQVCLRCKSGPVLCKKLPVDFAKACLLHLYVNILYLRYLFSASSFSISAENPDISVMTYCRVKTFSGLHVGCVFMVLPRAYMLGIFMYACHVKIKKNHSVG